MRLTVMAPAVKFPLTSRCTIFPAVLRLVALLIAVTAFAIVAAVSPPTVATITLVGFPLVFVKSPVKRGIVPLPTADPSCTSSAAPM